MTVMVSCIDANFVEIHPAVWKIWRIQASFELILAVYVQKVTSKIGTRSPKPNQLIIPPKLYPRKFS